MYISICVFSYICKFSVAEREGVVAKFDGVASDALCSLGS